MTNCLYYYKLIISKHLKNIKLNNFAIAAPTILNLAKIFLIMYNNKKVGKFKFTGI